MKRNFFHFLILSITFLLPALLHSQQFVSLENPGRFKRIRLEEGLRIRVKENHKDYWIRGTITRITSDSIYFGPSGVAVDSIITLSIPPGKGKQYLIGLLGAGIPGSFLLAVLSVANNLAGFTKDKNRWLIPAGYTAGGLGLLAIVIKLSKRKYNIGRHWELRVIEVPLYE